MKIQYASDLHLEMTENREELDFIKLDPQADILLLAGDILPFRLLKFESPFIDYLSVAFKKIYWIPGNHEYYGSNLKDIQFPINQKIRHNVFLINNQVIQIEDVNIICSTLWTRISLENKLAIIKYNNDFHKIRYNHRLFKVWKYNELHEKDLGFIRRGIQKYKGCKTIVMTHHVPTFLNYPEHYKGDVLSEAFAVELQELIEKSDVKYWIYGHHHHNTPEFKIGNTTLVTNQLGYVKANEHKTFRKNAILEI